MDDIECSNSNNDPMHALSDYQFCPYCAKSLVKKTLDGRARLVCIDADCGFVYYHNPIPGAGVIVYQVERGVLLVKRAHPPKIGWWCLPAGYMEWDESPSQTAKRETFEETGLEVEINALFGLYSGVDNPRANTVLALYEATVIGGRLQAGDDAYDARYFPLDALPEKIAFAAHRDALNQLSQKINS